MIFKERYKKMILLPVMSETFVLSMTIIDVITPLSLIFDKIVEWPSEEVSFHELSSLPLRKVTVIFL
jgi:vancomycin permeability regulator SanA